MKYVIVPQSDIDKLEQVRKYLWTLVQNEVLSEGRILYITSTIYYLTHRKYPIAKDYQLELDFAK